MVSVRYTLLLVFYAFSISIIVGQSDNATTFLFIRHAEKIRNGDPDPGLTAQGILRSKHWADAFKSTGIDAIYSTDTKRTLSTAEPTASTFNIDVVVYDAKTIDILQLIKINQGKTVLVVGHSNSTPSLVNELLIKEKYPQIEDDNNGNLYIVTIINGESTSKLLHID